MLKRILPALLIAFLAVHFAAAERDPSALSPLYDEPAPAFRQGERDLFRYYADLEHPPSIHPDPERTAEQARAETQRLLRKLSALDGLLVGYSCLQQQRLWYPAGEAWWTERFGDGHLPVLWEFELANQTGYAQRLKNPAEHRRRILQAGMELYRSGGIPCYRSHQPHFAGGGFYSKETLAGIGAVLEPGPARDRFIRWYTRLAVELREAKIPILFRPFHECTGPWFWWGTARGGNGNTPEQFVRLWREVHDIFRHHGADNVLWCWNMAQSPSSAEALRPFYPGDAYVDLMTFEMRYDAGRVPELYPEIIRSLSALAPGKPILTAEHAPAAKSSIIRTWHEVFRPYPQYKGWMFWAPGKYDFEVEAGSPPDVQQAFREFLDDPRTISKARWQAHWAAPEP